MNALAEAELWPGEEQEWLLRASLLRGDDALGAFEKWRIAPQDELDPGSQRLLPLLFTNLRRIAATGPELEPLESIYRTVKRENVRLFDAAAGVLSQLERAGLDTLLLKGACLVAGYYRDSGVRPMYDFDIAVRGAQAQSAVLLLERDGWTPRQEITPSALGFRHSVNFGKSDISLDLHWSFCFESVARGDADFWDAAVRFDFRGVATRTPATEDLLLHIVAHGTRRTATPLYWIADAVTVLRTTEGEFDWERLFAQVQALHVVLRVREGLRYLARTFRVAIPEQILDRLDALPITALERAEHTLRRRDQLAAGSPLTRALERVLVDYWRLRADAGLLRHLRDFPAYLWFRWDTRSENALRA